MMVEKGGRLMNTRYGMAYVTKTATAHFRVVNFRPFGAICRTIRSTQDTWLTPADSDLCM